MSDQRSSDVLGALPHSRPHRRSQKRPAKPAEAAPESTPETPRAKKSPPAKKASSGKTTAAKRTTTTTGAATKRTTTKRTTGPATKRTTGTAAKRATAKSSSRLQQPAQPGGTPRARRATQPERGGRHDVLSTAVQAAAELAEIGLTVGARALRSAVSRLPRP